MHYNRSVKAEKEIITGIWNKFITFIAQYYINKHIYLAQLLHKTNKIIYNKSYNEYYIDKSCKY